MKKINELKFNKNNLTFFKNINLNYIYNYYITNISILKNTYFILLYNYFIKRNFKKYTKKEKLLIKKKRFNPFLYFTRKYSIFNYYYLNFSKNFFFNHKSLFKIYPSYRNLFLSFSSVYYKKILSLGLFISKLNFKYNISTQKYFISYFFKRIQKRITKNIVLYILNFTTKFIYFIQYLKKTIKYLNTKFYKFRFTKILNFIFLIKFKTYTKRLKVRPRKKKAYMKKYYNYRY